MGTVIGGFKGEEGLQTIAFVNVKARTVSFIILT